MDIEKIDIDKMLTITNINTTTGKIFDELKFIGTMESFYDQLMLKDFVVFLDEKNNKFVTINSDNICYFDSPEIPGKTLSDYLNKYLSLLNCLVDIDYDDDGDDDDPSPNKPRKKGHLKIIK